MNSPVSRLLEMAAFRLEFVFDQERHDLGQLLTASRKLAKTSDIFTFHQRLAVLESPCCRSAPAPRQTRAIGLPAARISLQFDRIRIFGQIPHRPAPTRVEIRPVIVGVNTVEANGRSKLRLCGRIGFEPAREIGLEVRLVAFLGSSGGFPPFGEASTISAPASLNT